MFGVAPSGQYTDEEHPSLIPSLIGPLPPAGRSCWGPPAPRAARLPWCSGRWFPVGAVGLWVERRRSDGVSRREGVLRCSAAYRGRREGIPSQLSSGAGGPR